MYKKTLFAKSDNMIYCLVICYLLHTSSIYSYSKKSQTTAHTPRLKVIILIVILVFSCSYSIYIIAHNFRFTD